MNRQQRRKQERQQTKQTVRQVDMKQVIQQQAGDHVTKREFVAYTIGMRVALEALERTKGIGEVRRKEFLAHVRAIEVDFSIERNPGDDPDSPFSRELAKEIGLQFMGRPRKDGTA